MLSWALSFSFGCRDLSHSASATFANFELLKVRTGTHPGVGARPDFVEAASQGILKAIETHDKSSKFYGSWQFRLLVFGGVLYVAWHVLEMYTRTLR